ncbi:roundabout homolog 1 isoform X2 [Hydra vulgaris]|uniref:Roundabout homolog 1 isoform X2 n=1 Tax=Hydra vulgaris TaxID=6087 RepID=A0ABM4B7T7_HYDVU
MACYYCILFIYFSSFCLHVFTLENDDPRSPIIRQKPASTNISAGETFQLNCYSYGAPSPTIQWYKDDKPLNTHVVTETGALVVKNAQKSDEGLYKCIAENPYGKIESPSATVKFIYIDAVFYQSPVSANTTRLQDHTFRCIAPDGFPIPIVTWLHNGKPLATDNWSLHNDRYVSLLKLTYLSWKNHGEYQCNASNIAGYTLSNVAVLKVKVPAPVIISKQNLTEVYEGAVAVLYCEVQFFNLYPDRIWTKKDGILPEKERLNYPKDGYLEIKNTKLGDSGIYECTVSNDAGSDKFNNQLRVFKHPEIKVPPSETSVGVGYKATLDCKVTGGKNPVITWYHLGKAYSNTGFTNDRIYVDSESRFVVSQAKISDKGEVFCNVNDEEMKWSQKSEPVLLLVIDVLEAPPIVNVSPAVVSDVREGGSFSLLCTTGEGNIQLAWYLASKPITISPTVSLVEIKNGKKLIVRDVTLQDSGIYRCIADGKGGSSQAQAHVTILESDDKRPAEVLNVKVSDIQATSVKIFWESSIPNSLAPVTAYIITLKRISTNETSKTIHVDMNSLERVIDNLSPDTLYEFSVVAKNKNGEGIAGLSPRIKTLQIVIEAPMIDKLENVVLNVQIDKITPQSAEVKWDYVNPSRITSYILYYRRVEDKQFKTIILNINTSNTHKLESLSSDTQYVLQVKAANEKYESQPSPLVSFHTTQVILPKLLTVTLQKISSNEIIVRWVPPASFEDQIKYYKIICLNASGVPAFPSVEVESKTAFHILSIIDPNQHYQVSVEAWLNSGYVINSKIQIALLRLYKNGDYITSSLILPEDKSSEQSSFLKLVKETWFIVAVGVFLALVIFIIIIIICCRKKKNSYKYGSKRFESSRGLLQNSRTPDFPSASLSRGGPLRDPNFSWSESRNGDVFANTSKGASGITGCCKSKSDSFEEDFPNRVLIKPATQRAPSESFELRGPKSSNQDVASVKESNIGVALRNGYMVDAPLNNERQLTRDDLNDRFKSDSNQISRYKAPKSPDNPVVSLNSENIPKKDSRAQTNSFERRHAEIVRTANKSFPDTQLVNVLETNPQATWKREKDSDIKTSAKSPGENTLRRMGKAPFKPLPKLEVLNWADGLPDPAKNDGSQQSSPKQSSTASMFGDNTDLRPESRTSHGGSNGSLNKYPFEKRRRRTSNASSMMSSELYQSEMDPSAYSDVASERKSKKKIAPPPIDLDGLTSDILLQWADSVTNSSPSSSGSSSPSRLSGISSEGSFYTDADFANAVAAVAECNGFSMDYDYSLPGMPSSQPPLSSTRNTKMDKIDQVLAQRSKLRNSKRPEFVPQISMSNYLTGSSKGPNSGQISSGIPLSTRGRKNLRYGTGFQDVDTASNSSTPLTVSNLMHHDSSLERSKKPLIVSNQESSLERTNRRRQEHAASLEKSIYKPRNKQSAPDPPLSLTSALERNESINSNSKDSISSSNKHDSEVENKPGTAERLKSKRYINGHSSSNQSTPSTIRSTENELQNDY